MDWITTSGGSLDEAKSHALDQLGIVADEAEFDVINDVEKGFFGRVKTEAKVRARVRPRQPSVKETGNGNRNRKGGGRSRNRKGGGGNGGGGSQKQGGNSRGGNNRSKNNNGGKGRGGNNRGDDSQRGNNRSGEGKTQSGQGSNNRDQGNQNRNRQNNKGKGGNGAAAAAATATPKKKKRDTVEHEMMNREDQERTAHDFLEGVLGAFGMTGSVALVEEVADDDAIELAVSGDELGLLVGQKGMTLNALQELTRTVVQREADGAKTNRLRVDVAGYRARRTAALQDFARKIAADVADSGTEKLLEPMGPADRKVVHDTVNDIDGVETGSEGEEPRRRVVIRPT